MNEEYLYEVIQKALTNKLNEPRSEKFKEGILSAKSIIHSAFKQYRKEKEGGKRK